ncbi:hypothetical protein BT63DRAFT_5272 [Microthyrium microscopicum]|uniref:HCP-like protein n=1 Tax=Microthyrium microscopicum TaxID=703497 RepID=A0A6A6UPP4_9PEZI|nr:hypothetical protein BT63DRAFT_5272 [Microthyrium microscopicum]
MANRPKYLDLSSATTPDPLSRPLFTPHGALASPVHTNDVPPALSPLDAFAMQGRLLQKRFEEQSQAGRRLSRLPPNTITSEFGRARPGYFRSITTGTHGIVSPTRINRDETPIGSATEIMHASGPRPKSHYPQMVQTDSIIGGFGAASSYQNSLHQVPEFDQEHFGSLDFWSMPRSASPDELDLTPQPFQDNIKSSHSALSISPPLPPASMPSSLSPPKFMIGPSLLSPAASASRSVGASPSIRPVFNDPADDFSQLSLEPRSATPSLEKSTIPYQSGFPFARSPSSASDFSFSSNAHRPSFNFSRPMSRQSGPSLELRRPSETAYLPIQGAKRSPRPLDLAFRQDSTEAPLTPFTNDAPQTPISLSSDEMFLGPDMGSDLTPTSFVYKKYALGPKTKRESKRVSVGLEEFMNRQFNWDGPLNDSQLNLQLNAPFVLPQSPPSPTLTSSPPESRHRQFLSRAHDSPRPSGERGRKKLQKSRPVTPATIGTNSSGATIRQPNSIPRQAPAAEQSSEYHLEVGIERHEAGALQEATYHFRLAANAGHPTAMLLYALACRHGWGIKPNLAEGVYWLQQAVNSAQLEVAEDEDIIRHGGRSDVTERKTHKAQFALSVYELGVSYMNGWGVPQDKSLALRCFEIGGTWGDPDALVEAGLCYKEGIGCKRDMNKSAKFYRMAEAKGVVVSGNSWIHKDKYLAEMNDDLERLGRPSRKNTDESRKREKSRTRAFFTRKSNAS